MCWPVARIPRWVAVETIADAVRSQVAVVRKQPVISVVWNFDDLQLGRVNAALKNEPDQSSVVAHQSGEVVGDLDSWRRVVSFPVQASFPVALLETVQADSVHAAVIRAVIGDRPLARRIGLTKPDVRSVLALNIQCKTVPAARTLVLFSASGKSQPGVVSVSEVVVELRIKDSGGEDALNLSVFFQNQLDSLDIPLIDIHSDGTESFFIIQLSVVEDENLTLYRNTQGFVEEHFHVTHDVRSRTTKKQRLAIVRHDLETSFF